MRTENQLIKLDFLEHLAQTYRIVNDKVNEFWARKEIADVHHMQGKLDLAIDELLQIAKEQKPEAIPVFVLLMICSRVCIMLLLIMIKQCIIHWKQ